MFHRHSSSRDLGTEHRPSLVLMSAVPRSSTEAYYATPDGPLANRNSDERYCKAETDRFSDELIFEAPEEPEHPLRHSGEHRVAGLHFGIEGTRSHFHHLHTRSEPHAHLRGRDRYVAREELPSLEYGAYNFADSVLREVGIKDEEASDRRPVSRGHRRGQSEPYNKDNMALEQFRMKVKELENEFGARKTSSNQIPVSEIAAFERWAGWLRAELKQLHTRIKEKEVWQGPDSLSLQVLHGLDLDLRYLCKEMNQYLRPIKPRRQSDSTASGAASTASYPEGASAVSRRYDTRDTAMDIPRAQIPYRNFSRPHKHTVSEPILPHASPLNVSTRKAQEEPEHDAGKIVSVFGRFLERHKRAPLTAQQKEELMAINWMETYKFKPG